MRRRGRPQVRRIGWIVADQLARSIFQRRGYFTSGGVGLARFAWLASHVNARPTFGLHHEIYRPWRRYDAVVFLKSMGRRSLEVLRRRRERGCVSVFDANVNYYEREGREYYDGMLPSEQQRADAIAITQAADGVIADSEFVLSKCRQYNAKAIWIPDSVEMEQVPEYRPWRLRSRRLPLLWSGEAVKLFELLAIEGVLRRYARHVELVIISNSLTALGRWYADYRERFENMLAHVPHRIVPYGGIGRLFAAYAEGGVFVSPRLLDNSYNFGHTEWKITLAMACGRLALCAPVPSYVRVAEHAREQGIRICRTDDAWEHELDEILRGTVDLESEGCWAREVVQAHYSTAVVARQHAEFLSGLIGGSEDHLRGAQSTVAPCAM